jgi:hypothetical protein
VSGGKDKRDGLCSAWMKRNYNVLIAKKQIAGLKPSPIDVHPEEPFQLSKF